MLLAALTLSTPVIVLVLIVLAVILWPLISGSGPNVSLTEPRVTSSYPPAVALDPQVAAHRDLSAVAKHLEGRALGVEAGPHLDALAALISRRT